jgi:hypothetical protein
MVVFSRVLTSKDLIKKNFAVSWCYTFKNDRRQWSFASVLLLTTCDLLCLVVVVVFQMTLGYV